ncbi:MAG: TonB-dependent receptor [Terriglobia bacterium]
MLFQQVDLDQLLLRYGPRSTQVFSSATSLPDRILGGVTCIQPLVMKKKPHRWLRIALCLAALGLGVQSRALAQTVDLKGQVLADTNSPIQNAVCSLSGHRLLPQGLQMTTDIRGNFDFPALMPGDYSLTCAAVGRQPASNKNVVITAGVVIPKLRLILPPEVFHQEITVHAHAGAIAAIHAPAPPASISAHQLMALPLAELKFKAALPLVPGVIRTPDGKLNIKGAPEEQGSLLIDGADLVDPVTGSFSVNVPIDSIEELQVYKSPFQAQYGRFSGGLTVIQTKPPLDHWHWELNDLIPDVFIEQGHIQGIMADAPRFYLTGPLIKNKLNFAEAFIYDLNRQFVEGLPWPHNIRRLEGVSSFTNFQYVVSPQNLLSLNVRVFPEHRQFDNINALIPQPASTNYGQRGYSIGGTDRYLFGSGAVLTSLFETTEFDTYANGQGPATMLITPNGFGGNYFNSYRRFADQQQLFESYAFPQKNWHGLHDVQAGGEYFHRAYTGSSTSQSQLITDTLGHVLERIDFSGPAHLGDEDTEFEGYAQDHWVMNGHLSLDYGLRLSSETIGSAVGLAPRVGFVYSPSSSGQTVIHGGIGVFYDRVPMLAADYTENPARTITMLSASGTAIGPPQFYNNEYSIVGRNGKQIIPDKNRLGSTPYDNTWSLEVDQELRPNWLLRVSYLGSRGYNEFIVNPQSLGGGTNAFLLSNRGSSRYHEFQSTMRVRAGEKADFNFSYIHSSARGDLNTLGALYVPFEQPIIHPNFFADLPSNIPDRVITWAVVSVPWGLTLSPVFDIHSGFPYSSYDVLQNYFGQPDGRRFPGFYSLDLKISKDFHLPFIHWGIFKNHKFRGALQVYDITNHQNPVAIYDNIASPSYGSFVGFQHLNFDTYFDLIY